MSLFTATQNGYLHEFKINGVPSSGLVTSGDVIDYEGIYRAWLSPIPSAVKAVKASGKAGAKTVAEPSASDVTRKLLTNQLDALKVPYAPTMANEQLQAMLTTAKGLPA